MHFVTESELRTDFRKEAFTQFCLTNQSRLTPGAKQFLLDKKIQIISEADLKKNAAKKPLNSLNGYKEIVSSELLESALLAMNLELNISQQIIDLEKTLIQALEQEPFDEEHSLGEAEEFNLNAVHIFSEQGTLLIKLKKVYGIIHLIQAEYPQYNQLLRKANQKITELKKQLVGETNEKTLNESL
ncbi:hypothetical protein [Enterococcus caccae]|uniref:Uncharacterized protein n=1 Tax=Enterococcus caccae ATCC BAA-1240 TaxID=1158612 RepID=R3W7D6_9ENTE|nr:hypothetical protein [Enterococcus caccae]EOL43427.1 hypothetical protein UC7_02756 [Enterococcus caccae ATCC BAA-1240]EOT68173.1 hypothetical protein I580_00556 [Enterococcus caccae ATCC BAA-1240]OJG26963.1 hypothetical protein RU98_GL003054 [Enterococcus caccae]